MKTSHSIENLTSEEIPCPNLDDLSEANPLAFSGLNRDRILITLATQISLQELDAALQSTVIEAHANGIRRELVEEVVLHLAIYVGFPKALQSFSRLQSIYGHRNKMAPVASYVPGQFNFFLQPKIREALHNVHPDFGWLAGENAAKLCARGGLSPRERAIITLVSDIVQNVFSGPFEIHLQMLLECGGTLKDVVVILSHLDSCIEKEKLDTARRILGDFWSSQL